MEFKSTDALIADPGLRRLVDALAAAPRIESSAVGAAGTPSAIHRRFEELVDKLTPEQAIALLQHRSPIVRGYLARHIAAKLLGRVTALKPLLRDYTSVERQDGCIRAVSTVAEVTLDALAPRVAEPVIQTLLLEVARDSTMGLNQGQVLPLLVKVRRGETVSIAAELIGKPVASEVLRQAIMALGMARATELATKIADHAAHAERGVRAQVASSLGFICRTSETRAVIERLSKDDDDYVRSSAAAAYPRCPEPSQSVIRRLLGDKLPRVREAAARGLAESGTAEALVLLRPLLMGEASGRVMQALMQAQRGAPLTRLMRELLGSGDSYVRRRAADYLAEVGDRQALPTIRKLLDGPTIHERTAAAGALATLNDREAIPLLERLLGDSNPHGRIAAAKALVALKAVGSLPALERAVSGESTWAAKELRGLLEQLKAAVGR